MRFILAILLLCSIGAQGQIINASPFYKPYVSACSYLLDQYSGAAAAYSLRKLDCDYAGSAIRVRRSSDNTESDIGFVNGNLDTAALKTFVGTGGTDDGFVVTWYDQSGNTRDATQSSSTLQPLIVDNGIVLRLSGKPTVVFDGSNDYLTFAKIDMTSASAFIATRRVSSNTYQGIVTVKKSTGTLNQFDIGLNNDVNYGPILVGAEGNSTYYGKGGTLKVGSNRIITGIWLGGGTNGAIYYNAYDDNASVSLTSSLTIGASTSTGNSIIGATYSGASIVSYYGGWISELIIYNSDKSSDRSNINGNINTYYSIY